MNELSYTAHIREDRPGDFIVTFPDVPGAHTQGDTLEEAIGNAQDALSAALEAYLDMGKPWPSIGEKPHAIPADVTVIEVPVTPIIRGLLESPEGESVEVVTYRLTDRTGMIRMRGVHDLEAVKAEAQRLTEQDWALAAPLTIERIEFVSHTNRTVIEVVEAKPQATEE